MGLFICSECGTIENTALSRYWIRGNTPALCSACDPELGNWHDRFPRVTFDPNQDHVDEYGQVTMTARR